MDIIIGLSIFAVLAALYFGYKELEKRYYDYEVPDPKSHRSDILFGYYGSYGDTSSVDHTNLFWCVPHWEGLDKAVKDIRIANKYTVLDLQACLFEKKVGDKVYTPFPEEQQQHLLISLFNRLRHEGLLHLVKILYPVDEPNLPETAVDDYMPAAIALVRKIADKYPELNGYKIGVSFYFDKPMQHIGLYDVVGFNNYNAKSGIFRRKWLWKGEGQYFQMKKLLRPDQRTWTYPGGTYGQDPKSFINFAHSNPEVLAIIPFIYSVPPWETTFKGIKDIPEMLAKYREAGLSLLK